MKKIKNLGKLLTGLSMRNLLFLLSIFTVALLISTTDGCKIRNTNKRMICYFANWAGKTFI